MGVAAGKSVQKEKNVGCTAVSVRKLIITILLIAVCPVIDWTDWACLSVCPGKVPKPLVKSKNGNRFKLHIDISGLGADSLGLFPK